MSSAISTLTAGLHAEQKGLSLRVDTDENQHEGINVQIVRCVFHEHESEQSGSAFFWTIIVRNHVFRWRRAEDFLFNEAAGMGRR